MSVGRSGWQSNFNRSVCLEYLGQGDGSVKFNERNLYSDPSLIFPRKKEVIQK